MVVGTARRLDPGLLYVYIYIYTYVCINIYTLEKAGFENAGAGFEKAGFEKASLAKASFEKARACLGSRRSSSRSSSRVVKQNQI